MHGSHCNSRWKLLTVNILNITEVPKLSLCLRSSWCKPGHFIVVYGNTLFIRNKVLSQKLNNNYVDQDPVPPSVWVVNGFYVKCNPDFSVSRVRHVKYLTSILR